MCQDHWGQLLLSFSKGLEELGSLGACPRIGCLPEKKSDVIAQYIDPEMLSQRNYDDNET